MKILEIAIRELARKLDEIGDDETASAGYRLACKDNMRLVLSLLSPDRAEDGPEIDLINFFHYHPKGQSFGINGCLHV